MSPLHILDVLVTDSKSSMSRSLLEVKDHSIVFLGKFNPGIFHPQWLLRKDLIRESQALAAILKINHNEVSEFDLDYCTIQVLAERFSSRSTQETHFKLMRDLTVNIFECLPESHILQMGINLHHHYRFEDKDEYREFGHRVVPKDPLWNSLLSDPSLLTMNIQSERTDNYHGNLTTTVRVSNRIPVCGVEIQVNDHYNLFRQDELDKVDASRAVKILKEDWDKSLERSEAIIEGIFKHGTARS